MEKQKYRFSLTRARFIKIEYNKGLNSFGRLYDTYDYNSSEPISLNLLGENKFRLADEFMNKIITVASYINGSLDTINTTYLVNNNTRDFTLVSGQSYVFSWRTDSFEPQESAFIYFETNYTHPVFSKIAINKTRANYKMNWSTALNSDIIFKAGTFDYLSRISYKDSIIFKIERYINNSYERFYTSMPFSKADCSFDYDKRQLTVDFAALDHNAYLEKRLNTTINLAKKGYRHEKLVYDMPAMMQIYVDGTETVTNIVGGSATEVDVSVPEMPDDYLSNNSGFLANEKWWPENKRIKYLYNTFRFCLIGRIGEIRIVGSEPNGPAGYYYATTSDNQVSQIYTPTSNITRYDNTDNNYYIQIDTVTRFLYIKLKSDNSTVYISTQALNTNCLFGPDSIAGIILQAVNSQEVCAVETHLVHNIYARILTSKADTSALGSYKITTDDFAYSAGAYKYVVNFPVPASTEVFKTTVGGTLVDNHLIRPIPYESTYVCFTGSSTTQLTDSGLGASNPYSYFSYKNNSGSYLKQHYIPIGSYLWSGISFYACLSANYMQIMEPWYLRRNLHCFFTVGTAIRELLQAVAPNIRFLETKKYSSFLYPNSVLQPVGYVIYEPNIFFTHLSNIQAGLFDVEAQKIEISLNDILNLLQSAFQVYYFIDDDGYLHLEHISWFYGKNKPNNIQFDTTMYKDEYTKILLDYGLGTIASDSGYLYSSISMTSDTDNSFELFNKLDIKCLEATCALVDKKEVTLGKFRTDIDYILAESADKSDGLVMVLPTKIKDSKDLEITHSLVSRCDILGLNNYLYYLWPTNYKASSFSLLNYYRWNFASLEVDNCAYKPEERERFMKQEIQVPNKFGIDMEKMIKTRFGDGLILSYKLDIDSRFTTITLLHKG